jgi:hypothetical protein
MSTTAHKYLDESLQLSIYLYRMKIEIKNLMTIKNFALKERVTPSYVYKLIKEGRMSSFTIDGVKFIETNKFPYLPVINRR